MYVPSPAILLALSDLERLLVASKGKLAPLRAHYANATFVYADRHAVTRGRHRGNYYSFFFFLRRAGKRLVGHAPQEKVYNNFPGTRGGQ